MTDTHEHDETRGLIVTASDEHWLTWTRGPRQPMACHSAGLRTDDGKLWLFDPLDAEGLDEVLAEYGTVAGVVVLLDRHLRHAERLAERHGVDVWIPESQKRNLPDRPAKRYGETIPGTPFVVLPVASRSFWTERALWWPERRVLVAGDSLGTASYFRAQRAERIGVHPALRLSPPLALAPVRPDVVLVGHGAPLLGEPDAVSQAVLTARRAIPGMLVRAPKRLLELARGKG